MRLCVLLVLLGAVPARAEPDEPHHELSPAARERYERGQRLFGDKSYDAAIDEFRAGYAIEPAPVFLYNQAQAERLAGRCTAAIVTYRAFLATAPTGEFKTLATYNLGLCQLELKPAPAPPPVIVTVPRVELAPPPVWYSDAFAITLASGGVVGAGIGTGMFVAAHEQAQQARRAATDGTFGEFETHSKNADRDRLVGYIAGGVGVALLGAGVIRFAVLRARAAPFVTAGGGGGGGIAIVGLF